jgi:hypothetical protein
VIAQTPNQAEGRDVTSPAMEHAIRAVVRAIYEAFIRPVWATNAWLGPAAGLLVLAAGLLVGFISKRPLWGAIIVLAGAVLLALLALALRIARDTVAVPVSDAHRDTIKAIALRYRGPISTGKSVVVGNADWETFESHLGDVAAEIAHYNETVADVDHLKHVLRDYIGKTVDEFPGEQLPTNGPYKFMVDAMEALIERLNSLDIVIKCEWSNQDDRTFVTSNVTQGTTYGIARLDDPYLAAIRLFIEQDTYIVQHSDQMKAVWDAVQKLRETQNKVAESLDLIGRRDSISGHCQDCTPR